jgi:hypothetical protein
LTVNGPQPAGIFGTAGAWPDRQRVDVTGLPSPLSVTDFHRPARWRGMLARSTGTPAAGAFVVGDPLAAVELPPPFGLQAASSANRATTGADVNFIAFASRASLRVETYQGRAAHATTTRRGTKALKDGLEVWVRTLVTKRRYVSVR